MGRHRCEVCLRISQETNDPGAILLWTIGANQSSLVKYALRVAVELCQKIQGLDIV